MPTLWEQAVSVWESVTGLLKEEFECGNCGEWSCEPDEDAMKDFEAHEAVKKMLEKLNLPVKNEE